MMTLCVEPAARGIDRIRKGLQIFPEFSGRWYRVSLGVIVIVSLWPIARWWEGWIFPAESRISEAMEYREEMGQLRRIATGIRGGEVQPFLAPWYLSPAVSYWSDQPSVSQFTCLGGEGLDFATGFFASDDVAEKCDALIAMGVRWIICDAPDRFDRNARALGFLVHPSDEPAIRTLRRGRQGYVVAQG